MNKPPLIYPDNFPYTWAQAPSTPAWVDEMIPTNGSVLLYGPSGVGKTTLACQLLNAVATKQQFLGRNTNQCRGLFLSLDTPANYLVRRWLTANPVFKPAFTFVPYEPFNCTDPTFPNSQLYLDVQAQAAAHIDPKTKQKVEDVRLVVVDSLRDCFDGELLDDTNPVKVYGAFQQWFKGACVIFLHHTRKANFQAGKKIDNDDDEATGSKYWINKAQVSLGLTHHAQQILKLKMGKSQCFPQWDDFIRVELDGMNVNEWTTQLAQQHATTYATAAAWCQVNVAGWTQLLEKDRDYAVANHLGISNRTSQRYKAAWKKLIP